MADNIFQRFTGTKINLDNREGEAAEPGGFVYTLELTLTPATSELNREVTVRIKAMRNGLPWSNQQISVATTDQLIGLVPDVVFTNELGVATFAILTLNIGQASISAAMTVSGVTYESNEAQLTVYEFEPPENYDATGYGKITFSVEPILADAMFSRIQRLSHAEQTLKYPADDGLWHAHYFSNASVIFMPKSML